MKAILITTQAGEFLGKFEEDSDKTIVISNPFRVLPNGFIPLSFLDNDEKFSFSKKTILRHKSNSTIQSIYERALSKYQVIKSGLYIPDPKSGGQIH